MATTNKTPANLADALAELMQRLPRVTKNQEANIKAGFSYSYADLDDISRVLLPVLGEVGLSFTSRPTLVQRGDHSEFVLAYRLLHVSSEKDEGEYPLPQSGTPQQIGSAITYARRYCLCAVTGLTAGGEDDDGQAAEGEYRRTEAELQGKELAAHNALRREGAPRVHDLRTGKLQLHGNGTDPDDPFYAVDGNGEHRRPPPDLPVTYPAGERQFGAMQGHFKRLGYEDHERDIRLGVISVLADTGPIDSSRDITQEEVQRVNKVLEKHKTRASLEAVPAVAAWLAAVAASRETEDAGA